MPRGLELLIAQTILQGFDAQYGRFLEVTSGAQQRFEQADWHAVQQAMKNRIHLYNHHVGLVVDNCAALLTAKVPDAAFFCALKSTRGCCRITPASRLRRAFLTPCTVGYLTTARLLPSGFLSLALSQSAAFVPFPARWRRLSPHHGWESLLMRVISDLPLRLRWR
ncbi:isocitrate dehydrogenase kinase/phosphatase AceK regulatory subunit [Escherichia coli]